MTLMPSARPDLIDPSSGESRNRQAWVKPILLGIGAAVIFLANGREIGAWDTIPASLIPVAIVRGDGLNLDRFVPLLRAWGTPLPPFVTISYKHVISRYPVGSALLALPLVAPQIWLLDWREPGWDRDLARLHAETRAMAKRAAAIITSLLVVMLYRLLLGLGFTRDALIAVIATVFGSELWSVASQSLWQHGPAALALTTTLLFLRHDILSRRAAFFAGCAAGWLVIFRSLDLPFSLMALAWVLCTQPRRLAWFAVCPILLGAALLAYNLYFFGTITGGQAQLETLHVQIHGVGGAWSGGWKAGMTGTLFSPNRGLFVFSPWVALAVALAPWSCRRLPLRSVVRWFVLALLPFLVLLSTYSIWWAGGSFGPRYWTETFPLFGLLLACGLAWSRDHCRWMVPLFGFTILISIAIQAIGAFCYPSSWNFYPNDIDLHHDRLWNWQDTELSRCLSESWTGKRPLRVPGR